MSASRESFQNNINWNLLLESKHIHIHEIELIISNDVRTELSTVTSIPFIPYVLLIYIFLYVRKSRVSIFPCENCGKDWGCCLFSVKFMGWGIIFSHVIPIMHLRVEIVEERKWLSENINVLGKKILLYFFQIFLPGPCRRCIFLYLWVYIFYATYILGLKIWKYRWFGK